MFRKIFLPLIAIFGIGISIFMIYYGSRTPEVKTILFPPPSSPYRHYIAGVGIIESVFKNINIGTFFPEIISNIYIKVGDIVKKETPLFKLDTRAFESQLAESKKQLELAKKDYENYSVQFKFYEKLKDKSAVSEQAYQNAFYNKELAQKRVKVAQANIEIVKTNIEKSTIRAPIDGEVLQLNIRIGEFANVNPFNQKALILFGDTKIFHLRIDIDEEDSWRLIKGSKATAFVRGNSRISIPLEYVYTEPYIIPKRNLSGSDIERVDTRVLQVVYKFEREKYPVFAGELLDVYLEAKPSEARK